MDEKTLIEILRETLDALQDAYKQNREPERGAQGKFNSSPSRLVFARYRNPQDMNQPFRISEQELRFEFIRQLLKNNKYDFWYSIETPTDKKYSGFSKNSNGGNPICNSDLPNNDNGRSGAVDTMLFSKDGKRDTLIEFKANTPPKLDFWKDFVKMNHEGVDNNYFVHLLFNATQKTFDTVISRITGGVGDKSIEYSSNIKYYCIVLHTEKESGYKAAGIYTYIRNTHEIKPVSDFTKEEDIKA